MEGNAPEVALESSADPSTIQVDSNQDDTSATALKAILQRSVKRTRELFAEDQENIYITPSDEQER